MSDTPATPADAADSLDVVAEMNEVAAVIATARRLTDEGRTVNLSALEGKIGRLCAAVREAPPADRESVVEAMEKLVDALDELAATLTTRFGQPEGEAEGTRRRALDAYGQAPSDPDKEK